MQLVSRFNKPKVHNVSEGGAQADNVKGVKDHTGTLRVGQKLHLDVTPVDMAGNDFPGYSEIIKNFKRVTGPNPNAPAIQWRWGSGETEFSNSGNDPFHLGSYEPDGCTPAFRLETQVGVGTNDVWFEAFIEADDNGGVAVLSERLYVLVD